MLIAKGKLRPSQLSQQQATKPKQSQPLQSNFIVAEVEINDVPVQCRNMLTRGSTQDEISKMSCAAVSTRGRYMSPEDRSKNNLGERPLYLCIQGPTQESVDIAVGRVKELIAQGVQKPVVKGSRFSQLPPGFQPNIPPPSLTDLTRLPMLTQPPPLMSLSTAGVGLMQDKVFIGLEHAPPTFDVKGKVAGPRCSFLQHIMNETGSKLMLQGRGSGVIDPMTGRETMEALHVHIQNPTIAGLQQSVSLTRNLVETVQQEYAQFQHALAMLPTQVNPGTASLLAGFHQHTSLSQPGLVGHPPPNLINGFGQQAVATLPPPGMASIPTSIRPFVPGVVTNLSSSLPPSISGSLASGLILTSASAGLASAPSVNPGLRVVHSQPGGVPLNLPLSAPGVPTTVTTVYTLAQPGQLTTTPSLFAPVRLQSSLPGQTLQSFPPPVQSQPVNLPAPPMLHQPGMQPYPGQPTSQTQPPVSLPHLQQGQLTIPGQPQLSFPITSSPQPHYPHPEGISQNSAVPTGALGQPLQSQVTVLSVNQPPPPGQFFQPPPHSLPGQQPLPGTPNQPVLGQLDPGQPPQGQVSAQGQQLRYAAPQQPHPGQPQYQQPQFQVSQPAPRTVSPSSMPSTAMTLPQFTQASVVGQQVYAPPQSSFSTSFVPQAPPGSIYSQSGPPPSQESTQPQKRRFTEEKQEERLPEGLLGYRHGPPHLANLVASGPPPPPPPVNQQQQQTQPTGYGAPPPPPPPNEHNKSNMPNSPGSDNLLMPPPPPPPSSSEGDRQLMPPPGTSPNESDRKRAKIAIRGVTGYGSDEEEEEGNKQHQREMAKYSFNQYSSKPQMYGPPPGQYDYATAPYQGPPPPIPSGFDQYGRLYMPPPMHGDGPPPHPDPNYGQHNPQFRPPAPGMPFWMTPN